MTNAGRSFSLWLMMGTVLFWSIGSHCVCLFATPCCASPRGASARAAQERNCCGATERAAREQRSGHAGETARELPAELCSCVKSATIATPVFQHLVALAPESRVDVVPEHRAGFVRLTSPLRLTWRLSLLPPVRAPPGATRLP